MIQPTTAFVKTGVERPLPPSAGHGRAARDTSAPAAGWAPAAAAIERQDPRHAPLARSPELTREFYAVAGAALKELAEESGADPARMSAALARAKSDLEAFVASLSPKTRARLSALAAKLPAQ